MTSDDAYSIRLLEQVQAQTAGIESELVGINSRITKQEGRTSDLEDEVFGNEGKSDIGLKSQMRDVQGLIERGKGVMWFMGFVGVSNLIVLFFMVAGAK